MNAKHMWICLFLVFYSAQSPCTACTWITSQYRMLSRECLSQLQKMGGEFSQVYKPFPTSLYTRIITAKTENQVRFLAEVTEQITELFNVNLDSAKWDSGALDNFLNILNTRMLNELKNCAASYRETKEQRHTNMTLKKHFRKLKRILKKANYSADSWEQIRRLVRNHLTRMDIIASNLKSALTG
ncbi:hypothetical protein P4O66_018956 [Electrophorus voltai]|uniref:Uncharacterized protein n=1 Tax=Electrophorus voltai TaxID=2609070 RepID=A0AAD8YTG6_9TELE|nr:hypothetical protein P4O66_018956 [Electrophorus voltai]